MINTVPQPSVARNPRAIVKINDIIVRKIDNFEYIENNYYQPDSFHVTMPLYNVNEALTIEYWLSQPAIMINLLAGFPMDLTNYGAADLESLIIGGINNLEIRVFENGGGFAEFDGFDLSKKFIDNKAIDKYPNQKSSTIVTTLALQQGLTPVVTPTTNSPDAGIYYQQDYVELGSAISQWDLITYLAQREGYQAFVRGTSLFFQPRVMQSSNPYLFQAKTLENGQMASFNGTQLVVSRNLNYSRDVIVRIRSWNATSGRVDVQARATPTKRTVLAAAAQPIGEAQVFDYFYPGLSKQQAQLKAQKLLEDISQHERLLEVDCPADNLLRKDTVIQLQGVSQSADQTYFPDTITRRMSASEGYCMQVRAKNHSPQSVVLI